MANRNRSVASNVISNNALKVLLPRTHNMSLAGPQYYYYYLLRYVMSCYVMSCPFPFHIRQVRTGKKLTDTKEVLRHGILRVHVAMQVASKLLRDLHEKGL